MKQKDKKHHMTINVDGFTGNIIVLEMSEDIDKKDTHDMLLKHKLLSN